MQHTRDCCSLALNVKRGCPNVWLHALITSNGGLLGALATPTVLLLLAAPSPPPAADGPSAASAAFVAVSLIGPSGAAAPAAAAAEGAACAFNGVLAVSPSGAGAATAAPSSAAAGASAASPSYAGAGAGAAAGVVDPPGSAVLPAAVTPGSGLRPGWGTCSCSFGGCCCCCCSCCCCCCCVVSVPSSTKLSGQSSKLKGLPGVNSILIWGRKVTPSHAQVPCQLMVSMPCWPEALQYSRHCARVTVLWLCSHFSSHGNYTRAKPLQGH